MPVVTPVVLGEPAGDRRGRAIGEQVDHAMRFEVDDDRAVAQALVQGPVVEADDAWSFAGRQGHPPHQAQQGVGAGGHGKLREDARPHLRAGGESDRALRFGEPRRAPRPVREERPGLGEGAAGARPVAAEEASHMDLEHDLLP